jgi:hypothetical protein
MRRPADRLTFHVHVIIETMVAVATIVLIGAAVWLFVAGSQLFGSNVERSGVRISRFNSPEGSYVSGSLLVTSGCASLGITSVNESNETHIYLTEGRHGSCVPYVAPLPYTFLAPLEAPSDRIFVYIDGDAITTSEN